MKVCIAYESKYGNGKISMEHLKNIIDGKGHDVGLFSIREIKPKLLPQTDFYIFSAPTHIGGPPGKMKRFLKNLEIEQEGVKYSLITTYLDPETKALQKMEDVLQPKGMTKVSDGLKIKVNGMKGPLEEGYQKKLEGFAAEILG